MIRYALFTANRSSTRYGARQSSQRIAHVAAPEVPRQIARVLGRLRVALLVYLAVLVVVVLLVVLVVLVVATKTLPNVNQLS